MNFQVVSSGMSSIPTDPPPAPPAATETVDLLKQLLEVQKEQLSYQRAAAAAHDMGARWRTYLRAGSRSSPAWATPARRPCPPWNAPSASSSPS